MMESDIKRAIVKSIRDEGGYARRLEDQFTVGMPDLVLMPIGCPVVWAEVKVVSGFTFGPTPRQLLELSALHRVPHSIPIMIGWKNRTHFVSLPKKSIHIGECVEQQDGESIGQLIKRALNSWLMIK